ncbi:MAG: DUF2339 domain-containing protein [Lachnospiraceae bacterium]|nr:DUF2339 domain-containing protein [Lachnospiraceae bacterium]
MNQKETDFLNFENELLSTRKKLNDLIYKCSNEYPDSEDAALYQDKIYYLETELKYLNRQFQMLRDRQQKALQSGRVAAKAPNVPKTVQRVNVSDMPQTADSSNTPVMTQTVQPANNPTITQTIQPEIGARRQPDIHPANIQDMPHSTQPINTPILQNAVNKSEQKDYEKLFGKNFMGIFASVLIFISLIIFATLLLPYLTDTIKLIGLYIISFGLITAGFVLVKRNKENKFNIALIGCGVGSLYITLLLSNLYFKVFGDILLYVFILVWAVFVKYLTKLKSLIFHIIGQLGIFISSILGVLLCVHDKDATKILVLTIFYFISAFVFDLKDKRPDNADSTENQDDWRIIREQSLCSHIFKSANLIIYMIGFSFMDASTLKTVNILLLMAFILTEFYFSFKEKYTNGIFFQVLTIVNTVIFIFLFNIMEILAEDYSYAFMYIVSVAVLFYVNYKNTECTTFSEICCFILICLGCYNNPIISKHLFVYLTVVPFMLYGKWKENKLYLYTSLAYIAAFFFLFISGPSDHYQKIEYIIMLIVVFAAFLYVCQATTLTAFKVTGYLMLCLITLTHVHDFAYYSMHRAVLSNSLKIDFIGKKSFLITFFTLAVIHLVLNKLEYFGKEKPVEVMMYAINGLLMTTGCFALYETVWQIPVILLTILLFLINSKRILQKTEHSGYYVMFKYTVLMFCILDSYDVINYAISICLLLFAIISIVIGFYKSNKSFRLYGLILSMVSIFKLIMIDIHYDSTMENAVSFFVSGILCFIISFIYNRIDHNFQKK